jgi:hypothetical protein
MNVEPEPPTAIDPSLPAAVDGVIARSLAKNPSDRTPDVATFAEELGQALTPRDAFREPIEQREIPKDPEDSLDAGAFEGIRDLAPSPRERASRRRSVLGPASALIVLLVGVVAVVFHLRSADRGAALLSRAEAPVALATAPPTAPPAPRPTIVPTAVPTERPPTPAPTARPTEKPTQPPRAERTVERPKPTAPAVVARPTIALAVRVEPNPPPVALPPRPVAGKPSIDVISEPPGAEVLVDGALKGRTPLRISDLEPGSYRFEVRKEGRSSYRQTTELEADADYTMKVSLPITVNSLRVLSQPDGIDVKLNGVAKGRTPLTLSQLPDGHYDVTGELDGFEPQTLAVDLKDGELQEVRFTFQPKAPDGR